MTFDFKNPKIGYIFAMEGDARMIFFKMISTLPALTSYAIIISVGRTCLAAEEKIHMLISTFGKHFHFRTFSTDFFENVFYSALPNIV